MSDLIGIIAPLRKFLSNTDEIISVPFADADKEILPLNADRTYHIPDFQREIRWGNENIAQLIDDIGSGPKYLGNVIFTQHPSNKFSVIDGQQRITVLIMILACIKKLHGDHIDVINPCAIIIESFDGFSTLLQNYFPPAMLNDKKVIESDKLHQRQKYADLWKFISNHSSIKDQRKAQQLIDNLGKSTVNIILNKSDDINDGIRYFIDVNLKGKQLDIEDIFKSYLFKNDQSADIRTEWYKFKENVTAASDSKMDYPLLKLLEHYFYCDLYKDPKYKGMEFGEDFLLKKEFKTREPSPQVFREGIHLIELIGNKQYMLSSLRNLNEIIEIMLEIVMSSSTTIAFENYFTCVKSNGTPDKFDSSELKIIHNLLSKILKDSKTLPKALIMKYILTVLLGKKSKAKSEYQRIYGVYLLSVLFVIFENKKSKDILFSVLKADNTTWYAELINQANSYFPPEKITDNRLLAQYRLASNEEEEDFRFRCKSLATIYNFFKMHDSIVSIKKGLMPQLYGFITDDEKFTLEHLIISNSSTTTEKIVIDGKEQDYTFDDRFYKKNVNSLFNFVFIPKQMNFDIGNYWLPRKLELIDLNKVDCSYSKMFLSNVQDLGKKFSQIPKSARSCKDDLDLYFARDYKEDYITFAKKILKAVIAEIKG